MADEYPVRLKKAIAQAIAAAGLGVYRPEGASYRGTERGITTDGPVLLTSIDNTISVGALTPISDGRADMIYRFQFLSRVKGTPTDAENFAWKLRGLFDHKQNVPAGFNISWVEVFAEATFTADTNGRSTTSQTIHFRGRRPL